jgi:TM2 domain-containing membrane protein YozV
LSAASAPTTARNPWAAAALAWVFPGLGHAYLGRPRRALIYAAIVSAMFALGLSFQGRLYSIQNGQPLTMLATFAVYGAGLLNLAARLFSSNPSGSVLAVTYEYGCAYLLTSGLMNLLLVLDAYDIAAGRKP